MYKVADVYVRQILNSNGGVGIEAEVAIEQDTCSASSVYLVKGIASSPAAILAGRREKSVTPDIIGKIRNLNVSVRMLTGKYYVQEMWDNMLETHMEEWGADLTLALSLAFSRAAAQVGGMDLVSYIRGLMCAMDEGKNISTDTDIINTGFACENRASAGFAFSPLVPVFSGGVHAPKSGGSIQQIMLAFEKNRFSENLHMILDSYQYIEEQLQHSGRLVGYSASSGFLTSGMETEEQFCFLADVIERFHMDGAMSIAIDVAAEHLKVKDGYRYYGKLLSAVKLKETLLRIAGEFPVMYIEDPFDASDEEVWHSFYEQRPDKVEIISDDLSATQTKYLDDSYTDGLVVKMKQAGTLTETLRTVSKARKKNMKLCVSHRSYETEDTFMCDLGVAVRTDFMKIGGPRRGDRVLKYNQLLRLGEKY